MDKAECDELCLSLERDDCYGWQIDYFPECAIPEDDADYGHIRAKVVTL
jgi:hypothetical protein